MPNLKAGDQAKNAIWLAVRLSWNNTYLKNINMNIQVQECS